jgi:hypothetical protein
MPANAVTLQGRPVLNQIPDQYMSLTWVGGPEGSWQPSFTAELSGTPLVYPFEPVSGNLLKFNGTSWEPFDGLAVPNWNASQSYVLGDKVYYQGLIYFNRGSVTSANPAADPANWEQASGGTYYLGPTDPVNVAYWMRMNFEGAYSYIPVYR